MRYNIFPVEKPINFLTSAINILIYQFCFSGSSDESECEDSGSEHGCEESGSDWEPPSSETSSDEFDHIDGFQITTVCILPRTHPPSICIGDPRPLPLI